MTMPAGSPSIVLLTAGVGGRLGTLTEKRNKGLLSIDNRAILSHIVDRLPNVPLVVAVGHYGDQVRDFLQVAHPERRFVFVPVQPYDGPGSSSGYSLYSLRPYVPGPFIFCTNDTIVQQQIEFEGRNWVGVAVSDDIDRYTTVSVFGSRVARVCRKGEPGGALAYVGLAEIHDADLFWDALGGALEASRECSDIEGLFGLIETDLRAKQVDWLDTGSKDGYDRAVQALGSGAHLPKEDEDTYFQRNGRVVKFYSDPERVRQRLERAAILGEVVPRIVAARGCFYAYEWVEGANLSEILTPDLFRAFLAWAEARLWLEREIPAGVDPRDLLRRFYVEKTRARLQQLYDLGYVEDAPYAVNETPCKRAGELLEGIEQALCGGGAVFRNFHGDLHPDNIVVRNATDLDFVLLDWRENFGGCLEVGDIYYDLAKLYHGFLVAHDAVKAGAFSVAIDGRQIEIDIPVRYRNLDCIAILEEWAATRGLSVHRLRCLTALVYLNIAPLHHYPYNQFLYFLGLRMLQRTLEELET